MGGVASDALLFITLAQNVWPSKLPIQSKLLLPNVGMA